ncbi:uncharacterized protein LOC124280822 isoform X2 [Haliotis rubra]|uniref:uncharacterized protein LOC124280822 isoform X2 n=1 Tax=Haliotis rubra TaxID=36100 RepID=UPI001EE5BDDB|nr:uncharacterized protein LOC124280822 isoform X2 [Haliotis rubra]
MTTRFSRIIKQLGYERILLAPNSGRVIIPGLPYSAFDAQSFPKPWYVMNLMDSTHICLIEAAHGRDSLLGLHELCRKYLSFSSTAQMDFHDKLYNESVVKAPLCLDTHISDVGNSSYVMETEMKAAEIPLARYRSQLVLVDTTSRKPIKIPQQWKDTYGHLYEGGQPMRFHALEKPCDQSRVIKVSVGEVPNSDTDGNGHLNFSNYLKYCCDGLVKREKRQTNSSLPIRPLLLKSASMWYRKECNDGDDLELEIWEHEKQMDSLCVDMLRNGDSVFQCKMELYKAKHVRSSL